MTITTCLTLLIAIIVLPIALSMILEALRREPQIPESLYWSKDIPICYITIDGMRIRYIQAGKGPNLVLLHTLRTQLDIFQKVVPELIRDYTVYAPDYPGHGFSDIPKTEYTPELFVKTIEGFLEELDIKNTTLAGVSIGGSIPLLIATKHNPRVKNIISINPYDYGKGRGIERGNFIARLIITLARIPVLGETVMRFRNTMVEKIIMEGGVARPDALPKEFLQQVWDSGVRKGHYRGFINLIRNAAKWEQARHVYAQINIPVVLVYGDKDWSRENERNRTLEEIRGAKLEIVKNGGHFLSLDQPGEVIRLIKQYATAT
jgi:Predicted hydrolases or acyltransferases (alpha/beta hydrolase superfamily)